MKNKWVRRAAAVAACLLIVFFGTDLLLRWASSAEWVKKYALEKTQAAIGREVRLDKVSVSLLGVKLNGLSVSEEGGFKNGTFVSADRVRLRFALLHLLHAHLKLRSLIVNGAEANIIRQADGTFNFDSLIPPTAETAAPAEPAQEEDPFHITMSQLVLRNVTVNFADLQNKMNVDARDLFLSVYNFGFDREARIRVNTVVSYEADGKTLIVPLGVGLQLHPAQLNLKNAYVKLVDFSAKYKDAAVNVTGRVDNLEAPAVSLAASVRHLSSDTVSAFAPDVPEFLIPQMTADIKAQVDLEKEKVTLNSLAFIMPGTQASASGWAAYGDVLAYDIQSAFDVRLAEFAAMAPSIAQEYKPSGALNGAAELSEKRMTASVALQQAGGYMPYAGEFSNVTASFAADEAADLTQGSASGKMSGKLNGEAFDGHFKVKQTKKIIDVVMGGSAKRVVLPPAPAADKNAPEPTLQEEAKLTGLPVADWPYPPMNVKADFFIGSMDAPYFYGTDMTFKADLKNITPDLKNAQGALNLAMGNGEIKDLYKLTDANALTKVLFMSLTVVGKVFNTLNVFAVLNGIGSGIMSAVGGGDEEKQTDMVIQTVDGPDGKPMQIMVPFTDRKIEGHMVYEKFTTDVNFKDGVADVRKGSFVSDTMSFRLDGTTDFKTEKIKMTVHAAPGKHYTDGIMPLTLTVGGTISDPKGSMSMVGSLTSLLTQTVANNFASRSVKGGVGGVLGLFKKKQPEPEKIVIPPWTGEEEPADGQAVPAGDGEDAGVVPDGVKPEGEETPAQATAAPGQTQQTPAL